MDRSSPRVGMRVAARCGAESIRRDDALRSRNGALDGPCCCMHKQSQSRAHPQATRATRGHGHGEGYAISHPRPWLCN